MRNSPAHKPIGPDVADGSHAADPYGRAASRLSLCLVSDRDRPEAQYVAVGHGTMNRMVLTDQMIGQKLR
jgi:hypothetical protein